jgi:hypothetical protein
VSKKREDDIFYQELLKGDIQLILYERRGYASKRIQRAELQVCGKGL